MRRLANLIAVTVFLTAIFALLFTPGCSKKPQEPKEIKIGAILPLTGESALVGEWGLNGMKLAEEFLNSKAGVKREIRIIIEDGMGNPQNSLNAFIKLRDIEKTKFVLSIVSSVDLSLIPVSKKSDVLFLSHATHPAISGSHSLVFRHSPVAQQEVDIIASSIPQNIRNIVLAYMIDDYGLILKDLLQKRLEKQSKINLQSISFEKGEMDFSAVALKILESKPEYLIICGYGRNLGQLIVKLKEMGYKGEVVVNLGFLVTGAVKAAGESIKGVYGIDFDIDTSEAGYEQINKLYKSKYGSDIPTGALLFFNSTLLLHHAIENVGYDPLKVSNFLTQLKTFQGMGEKMNITKTNDITPSLKLVRF